jgi:hypothetical protein
VDRFEFANHVFFDLHRGLFFEAATTLAFIEPRMSGLLRMDDEPSGELARLIEDRADFRGLGD